MIWRSFLAGGCDIFLDRARARCYSYIINNGSEG